MWIFIKTRNLVIKHAIRIFYKKLLKFLKTQISMKNYKSVILTTAMIPVLKFSFHETITMDVNIY